jgi:MFS family permease
LNGYHWFVLIVATLGWMFDCLDQRLFVLGRERAMQELLPGARPEDIKHYGSVATALLLAGWATGGLVFGVMADRWGRAKTMLLTILVYSAFTGLSALSVYWWDFCIYRFLTGMGVGGEFAAGVALVAEVMPARARPHTLGLLQAVSAIGNITGSLVGYLILPLTLSFPIAANGEMAGWRLMFLAGVLPALLVVVVMRRLKEPETWQAAKDAAKAAAAAGLPAPQKLGSWRELLGEPRWRRNTTVGVLLVVAGAIGLWGVGFWSPELIRGHVLQGMPKEAQDRIVSLATALQDVGAFFGVLVFTWITARIGRRGAFAFACVLAMGVTIVVFGRMSQQWQIWWMIPALGFATLSVFGGYAIYLPELFPTRLRSTGTGFCYNVARYLTAIGVLTMGQLNVLYAYLGFAEPFRWAMITVASIYLLGLVVLPFAPETKDQPLPE